MNMDDVIVQPECGLVCVFTLTTTMFLFALAVYLTPPVESSSPSHCARSEVEVDKVEREKPRAGGSEPVL
jgi:hypothetical protein